MTQEERQLLLKDLCARLPYGVKIQYEGWDSDRGCDYELVEDFVGMDDSFIYTTWRGEKKKHSLNYMESIRPYLCPMSSMTEEEFELLKQYSGLKYDQLDLAEFPNNHKCLDFYLSEIPSDVVIRVFDWLNKYHFDYRLMIERGLALEAPKDMYKTK